jgi:hypothetical protein
MICLTASAGVSRAGDFFTPLWPEARLCSLEDLFL